MLRRLKRWRSVCRWHRTPDPRWISLILAAVLLTVVLSAINARIRPILTAMAVARVSNAVTATVNSAISREMVSEGASYDDIVNVETDSNGRATLLTSNLEKANLLRAKLLDLVLDEVSALSTEDFSIPLGNLTDIDLFSGLGPDVTIQVLSIGAARADFEHEFTSAGVNQTLHQILINVEVTVQILLPGETLELPVSTQVCVAETIIVGEVPQTYFQWEQ